ncbi:chemotaxis protein CheD [bacterium]|nr:chemotaxis protein CheD [bacterium]
MRTANLGNRKNIVLHPGDYFVSKQNVILSTLLGSCVSACLYDPVNNVMGMNHFLLSSRSYQKETPLLISDGGRYGVHAMELMINGMLKLGAKRSYLKAKAFGGGNVLSFVSKKDSFYAVGDANIQFIKEFLKTEKIALVSSDLGGELGRVIHFYAGSYSVFVRKIKKPDSIELMKRDRKHWSNSIEKQSVDSTDINLW